MHKIKTGYYEERGKLGGLYIGCSAGRMDMLIDGSINGKPNKEVLIKTIGCCCF